MRMRHRKWAGDGRLGVVREGFLEEATSLIAEGGQEPALRKGEWGVGVSI